MATLVVMAAGIGSRFGGIKQMTGFGPRGELLIEYTAADAVRSGFTRCVFVVKPGMREDMDRLLGDRLSRYADVRYAVQDPGSLPGWFTPAPGRVKPYGTVHAALCAREYVDGPFAILNADDFYGEDAFFRISQLLPRLARGEAAMVGYRLGNTLSEHGSVTRGVCLEENGILERVEELPNICRGQDGGIYSYGEVARRIPEDSLVSMNFWGFRQEIFPEMQAYFEEFLSSLPSDDLASECLLPRMVDSFVGRGTLRVSVTSTDGDWFGVTYQEDSPRVAQELLRLTREGKCRGL